MTALLKLLEQAAESAVEHRSGGGAAENSAQCATQQVAEIAALRAGQTDVAARRSGRLARCISAAQPSSGWRTK